MDAGLSLRSVKFMFCSQSKGKNLVRRLSRDANFYLHGTPRDTCS